MHAILLADPIGTRLMLEKTCLMRHRPLLLEARTGSEALRLAREHHPRLILFAADLVDMDGGAFCRTIREDPATRHTSLLLVAARQDDSSVRAIMEAGANDCLIFPLHRLELDRKIGFYLNIEPRRAARVLVQAKVESTTTRGFFLGTSVNLSASGMLLETFSPFQVGDRIHIRFFLPGNPREMDVTAHVVRIEVHPGLRRYGLQFDTISDADAALIRAFAEHPAGEE